MPPIEEATRRILTVNRRKFELRLYGRRRDAAEFSLLRSYEVAVGRIGQATPEGLYVINSRLRDPAWHIPDSSWARDAGLKVGSVVPGGDPANPLKERWLGVTEPAEGVGIHGTDNLASIGTRASAGCIRMTPDDVCELYPLVPLGTPCAIT